MYDMNSPFNINDYVKYWIYMDNTLLLVKGHIISFKETDHKSLIYVIKRDHFFQDNIGDYELDTVGHISIIGLVEEKK